MDHYFDFDEAAIPPLAPNDDFSLPLQNDFDILLERTSTTETTHEPETFVLKLINDREVEAVKWEFWNQGEYPMYKAKTPCSLCASMGMDCFLASRGMLVTGCGSCIALYRECSFTHPEPKQGTIATFPGIAEDEQVCHGSTTTNREALKSFNVGDSRGRKAGSRFHRDAVKILKTWLAEHTDHPYPNERERDELKQLTGLKRSQINNWLANARRRGKVRPASDPTSPMMGAMDIPQNMNYENLGPLDRWKASPPEHEPASMTAIAQAVTKTSLPPGSLQSHHASRGSSRKASSEDDSNLSIMFQPPSESSFATRDSTNSSFSFASSRSHQSRRSFASSNDRRRRRRNNPLLQRNTGAPPSTLRGAKQKQAKNGKDRIFQCTFCTDSFPSKYDWQRHEKSLHLALERWTCCPMGATRILATTGQQQCVFCPEINPSLEHSELHNYSACNEKTVAERTFYRKDHLRQHLRLMHGVKYDPHMDTWKSTTFEIKSACGFCPSLFSTWQARADHLAAHFRNGADMKEWVGGWGFEPFVEKLLENAIPPYLIGHERNSMDPFRAREIHPLTQCSALDGERQICLDDYSVAGGRTKTGFVPQDTNCWHRLEEELIKFVIDKKNAGIIPADKEIQDFARIVIYGDPDPVDWTMADNDIWLSAFKCEHGLLSPATTAESPEYQNTRAVPVAAPYVVKGGLKSNKKTPSRAGSTSGDARPGIGGLGGVQERSCPLSLQSTNSSYSGMLPPTPMDSLMGFTGAAPGPIDDQQMDLDFDAIDFEQLELNAFGEMEFDEGFAAQKPLPTNTFTGNETTDMTLAAFDQLTGYTESFR